ncbi:helix-turn-helix domain-containing protein [Mucilaginibacter sp. SP1R1]|uniref:helix-turn-helix domain-containing protein n=1 Tax=Mucilaginibacter sp. SP1R1 TaxID=2723091 RepID=UPI00161D4637|nr:helix-turn-helix transcriptional regulator [Mucilaginibacter sp. SP1R1]MBB6149596.1 transcriptional regulator with XRE-family HTH domain [Mucilaginibacter sp. SP1R1]
MENNNNLSDREKIAGRLKEARLLSGLSQAQAADKLGLLRPAITEIEAGKRKVSAEEIIQFAEIYKVDTSWLLLREEEDDSYMNQQIKVAARELGKMKPEDMKKLLHVLKILPK